MSELLALDARCPTCRARPNIRIPPEERELARSLPPERLRQTYQCHACGTRLPLTNRAFARAA